MIGDGAISDAAIGASPDAAPSDGDLLLICTVGAASATGSQAIISNDLLLSCTVGNAAATGAPATVSNDLTVSCTVGNASATGAPAAITVMESFDLILSCAVGNASATGSQAVITLPIGPTSISRNMLVKAVRDFVLDLAEGQRVLVTPTNRSAMPQGAFVAIAAGSVSALATNTTVYDGTQQNVKRSSEFDCQIDCYGPDSADLATKLSILWRDQYAVEKLAASGLDIAPLYADDAQQLPIINGEEQYEERWSFKLTMQFNPIVSTPQQSATIVSVTPKPIF